MNRWSGTVAALVATMTLTSGCGLVTDLRSDQPLWEDASDYDPSEHEVDAQGRSLVAEGVIEEWVTKRLEPDFGEPDRVDPVRHSELVDDFGVSYGLQRAYVSYWYDMSYEEFLEIAALSTDSYDAEEQCGTPEPRERRRTGEVRWCLASDPYIAYIERDRDLPKAVRADVWWHEYKDGTTQGEFAFEYDPRYE